MHFTDRILILRRIAHNDNTFIIDVLGRRSGRISMAVKTGRSAEGRRKRRLSVPPQCLDIEALRTRKGLPVLKSVRPAYIYKHLGTDIYKTAQALFLADTLRQTLRGEPGPESFDKFCEYFLQLDKADYDPDFHLRFMFELSNYLGFAPQTGEKGTFFDVNEGKFTGTNGPTTLDAERSQWFKAFLQGRPVKNRKQRMEILRIWEMYFQLHTGNYHLPESVFVYNKMLSR